MIVVASITLGIICALIAWWLSGQITKKKSPENSYPVYEPRPEPSIDMLLDAMSWDWPENEVLKA